jgi:hypothetical protein
LDNRFVDNKILEHSDLNSNFGLSWEAFCPDSPSRDGVRGMGEEEILPAGGDLWSALSDVHET